MAAICGVRARATHEGQAASELEGVARLDESRGYEIELIDPGDGGPLIIDGRGAIRAVVADLAAGVEVEEVSSRFHNGLAKVTAAALMRAAEREGTGNAVLSGGVFQNRLLLEATARELRAAELRVLIPELLPPNDGGISYGQAVVAAAARTG